MKKVLVILLAGLLVLTFMVGCGKKEEPQPEPAVEEAAPAPEDTTMMEDTTGVMDTTMHMMDTAGQ